MVLQVVVVVEQPDAEPSGQDQLPGVVVLARGQVHVSSHDADILQDRHYDERPKKGPFADGPGEQPQGRYHRRHSRQLDEIAEDGPATQMAPGVAVSEKDVSRCAKRIIQRDLSTLFGSSSRFVDWWCFRWTAR